MPYFKKEKYIKDSLNSILNQSFKKFEIILINDEENPKTKVFLEEISKSDSRIKLIHNFKNLGAGESRNNAIGHSKGDLIAFCDCDDLWEPNKLETQLNFMQENNLDFCFTSYNIINEENRIIGCREAEYLLDFQKLRNSCDIGLSTVILKKKILKNQEHKFAKLKTKEDYVLWLKLAKTGIKLFGLKKILSSWRKDKNSLSSSTFQKIIDGYKVYRIYLRYNVFMSFYLLAVLSINFLLKKNK